MGWLFPNSTNANGARIGCHDSEWRSEMTANEHVSGGRVGVEQSVFLIVNILPNSINFIERYYCLLASPLELIVSQDIYSAIWNRQ